MTDFIKDIIDFVIHIDKHLAIIIQNFGAWSYGILSLIIFAETGFVFTPFLPGDSLLFAAGALAAIGSFNVIWLFIALAVSAVLGDTVNYTIGKVFGERLFCNDKSRFFKKEYLERTNRFYEKYGRKTIILARFVPIIRTFAPFVAGMCKMRYITFFASNVIGGVAWVAIFIFGGFYFGNLPVVKKHFTIVILAIIIISVLPIVIEFWKAKHQKNKNSSLSCK
jgi:membrane-associated protein